MSNPQAGEEREVLIDHWFPVTEVGIESVRERSVGQNPAPNRLHVWFARRPLTTSRGAILASLLPPRADRRQVLKLLGIPPEKDVAKAARLLEEAKAGKKLAPNPFTWQRAFRHTPTQDELAWLGQQLRDSWGGELPTVLDPMAGGGSIPYEALRLGLPTIAGELNPVAYIILKATLEYPVKFGAKLKEEVKRFCDDIHEAAKRELEEFFPKVGGEKVYAYLWCRTIRCQHCGLMIPLSPNWWIVRNEGQRIAVKPIIYEDRDTCSFEILEDPEDKGHNPDEGTDIGKEARCPRCRRLNGGDYVKSEAQAGRMGHQMYAVCSKRPSGRSMHWYFRTPRDEEIQAAWRAEQKLREKLPDWEGKGLVPIEKFPEQSFDTRPIQYGMPRWCDLYNPRQLLTHLTYLEKFNEAKGRFLAGLRKGTEEYEFAEAVAVYGATVFDTCVNYNCVLTRWAPDRVIIKAAMDLQAFPFKTSYAEWNQLLEDAGYEWALSKTLDALGELVGLLPRGASPPQVYWGDAAYMPLPDKSIQSIVVDPPYYENVMYGEVMDFFYVWLKRLLGDLFPDVFRSELIDKREEAVANVAMFRDAGHGMARQLADQHYRSKMEACFRDMRRVLRDDGVMTVMFTHRKAEAWAGLATALINAGFTFRASWPVFTEPGEKFGKREKGVLKVTVLLACRKRLVERRSLWEEVQRELYAEAERKVKEHAANGIAGPDLLVSVYGPVLGRFADYSLVKDATGGVRSAEDALEVVAEVVNRFITADIPGADLPTLAYLNLVRSFPYLETETDMARLATVFGGNVSLDVLDIKGGMGLVEKRGGKTKILTSRERVERGLINPSRAETLRTLIDTVHACLLSYERLGPDSVKVILRETGRDTSDSGFLSVLRALHQLAINDDAADRLVDDGRIAGALLEAMGHQAEAVRRRGESIDDFV